MQPSGLGIEEILPDPENGPRAGGTQGQGRGEAGRGRQIGSCRGIDLMQSGARDPASQRLVQRGHPERDPLHRRELARQPRQSEALPQGSQSGMRKSGNRFFA